MKNVNLIWMLVLAATMALTTGCSKDDDKKSSVKVGRRDRSGNYGGGGQIDPSQGGSLSSPNTSHPRLGGVVAAYNNGRSIEQIVVDFLSSEQPQTLNGSLQRIEMQIIQNGLFLYIFDQASDPFGGGFSCSYSGSDGQHQYYQFSDSGGDVFVYGDNLNGQFDSIIIYENRYHFDGSEGRSGVLGHTSIPVSTLEAACP